MNFLLIIRLFNSAELERIKSIAKELSFIVTLDKDNSQWEIHGLDPANRQEVEAFFELANVEI